MGSGISGNYSGTIEMSQPYSTSYEVCKDMLEKDKQDIDIYNPNTGYCKNPTATNLSEAIIGDGVYIGEKRMHGKFPYILTEYGEVIFGKRVNPNNPTKRAPHPTLIGGKNPLVKCAGMITFSKGKIVSIDNDSGHFKPNVKSMLFVNEYMNNLYKLHPTAFSNISKWRKKNEKN